MVRMFFVYVIFISTVTANAKEESKSIRCRSLPCGTLQYQRPVYIGSNVTLIFTPSKCPNVTSVTWFRVQDNIILGQNEKYIVTNKTTSFFVTFEASEDDKHKDFYVKTEERCNCMTREYWIRLYLGPSKAESDSERRTCKQSTIPLSPTSVTSTSTPEVYHTTNKGQGTRSTEVRAENKHSPIASTLLSESLGTTPTFIESTATSSSHNTTQYLKEREQMQTSIDPKERSEPKSTNKRLFQLTLLLTCGGFVICVAIAVVIAYYRCKTGKYRPRYQPKFNIEEVSEGTFDDQTEHEGKMDNVYAKVHRPNMVKPKRHAAAADGNENQLSECRELNYADLDIEHLQSTQRSRPANQRDDADRTEYVTVDFTGF